jgi:hypothetical protein
MVVLTINYQVVWAVTVVSHFFHLPGRLFNAAHEDISKLAAFSPSFHVFRASPAVLDQYVTLQEYFSDPSFSYLLFSNPTHKTKPGTANRWETTSSNSAGQGSLRALEIVHCSGSEQSSNESTGYDCCTSSKISNAGPHIEHRWRCSSQKKHICLVHWKVAHNITKQAGSMLSLTFMIQA